MGGCRVPVRARRVPTFSRRRQPPPAQFPEVENVRCAVQPALTCTSHTSVSIVASALDGGASAYSGVRVTPDRWRRRVALFHDSQAYGLVTRLRANDIANLPTK
jgi:hypothetical protein